MHAELMLVIATAVWGLSFVLAKESGAAVNAAVGEPGSMIGPVFILAVRFALAALIWVAVFPRSLSGWNRSTSRGPLILGAVLSVGLILQHLALDRVSEAVAAFLTSLAVVFVPLILWLVVRETPKVWQWLGVAVAVPGVWLMSNGAGLGFGAGEVLGLSCAAAFAVHLILINRFVSTDSAWRATLGQFVIVAAACAALAAVMLMRGPYAISAGAFFSRSIALNVVLLAVFPTVVSFGLMTMYQPRVSPVRAVIIYMAEPIFAGLFAYLLEGRLVSAMEAAGAGLILLANAVVELAPRVVRRKAAVIEPAG